MVCFAPRDVSLRNRQYVAFDRAKFAALGRTDYQFLMTEFLVQRIMPGVARLSLDDLKQTSRMGMAHLRENFPDVEWLESYATDDILYCIYRAPSEAMIREYARGSTLPVHKISEVHATLTPTSVEH